MLNIVSANAQGLKLKIPSLKSAISNVNAAIFTIQETHFRKKGLLKIENYEIFEAIRKKQSGGSLIGAHKALNPILMEEYNEDFELLVVEVKVGSKEIWVITGYGPQETWPEEQRLPFFQALEKVIIKAELQGKSIFVEMDSNSKLGPNIVPKDPHNQTQNGKMLADIIDRHGLKVANSIELKCIGAITRKRNTKDAIEESIIDHVIVSGDLENELDSIIIDEKEEYALTKIVKTRNGMSKKSSDHNTIITKFSIKWSSKFRKNRIEMFNLKNKECQLKFKDVTTKTDILTDAFNSNDDLNTCTKNFLKSLNNCIRMCFKKVRITEKTNKEIEVLFNQRRSLRNKKDTESKKELEKVESKLADLCAKHNYEKIMDEINAINYDEGGFNSGHLWKLKKKISPKCRDPPTAMLDECGNVLTGEKAIEHLAVKTYKKRLENRKINDDLKELQNDKEELCKLRLKVAGRNTTPDWNMDHLEAVLKYLKKNKNRDPFGYANDIFHTDVAGDNLKKALLILMNRIKRDQKYPQVLEDCDITSIFKNKGARNSFENYRGIFKVPVLRAILDRLIYNDEYGKIDAQLSDSNVGARKNRNIRDNIFVLNAISNSVVNGKEDPIDIQLFDVEKCFDALWVEECINDIFEAGLTNDKLVLLYLENQNANIAVKTPRGRSSRVSTKNLIMQGTVWASFLCTVTMDKLGKFVYNHPDLTYKYKGVVETPSLGMVDDVLCVQKCSTETVKMNSIINSFMESKKLKLSSKKCHRIHVQNKTCKKSIDCHNIKVHKDNMETSTQQKYLGDIINTKGSIRNTIEERKSKGFGIANEIIAILEEIPLGRFKMEIGLKLRQAMLLNGILYNSEAWHNISETEIRILETVDEYLLRALVKAHSKTALEFLYLESGAIPIRFIIASRRLIYHHNILNREEKELVKRIYKEQKNNPSKGDFVELIKEDFKNAKIMQNDVEIQCMQTSTYKEYIKKHIRNAAFEYLTTKQASHSKVNTIKYTKLETQKYMVSPIFLNEEVNQLHALRSRTTNCKMNFKNKYRNDDFLCGLCNTENQDQPHLLRCNVLIRKLDTTKMAQHKISYEDIYSNDVYKQKEIASLFLELFKLKSEVENSRQAPSTTDMVLVRDDDLSSDIVHLSSGT